VKSLNCTVKVYGHQTNAILEQSNTPDVPDTDSKHIEGDKAAIEHSQDEFNAEDEELPGLFVFQ